MERERRRPEMQLTHWERGRAKRRSCRLSGRIVDMEDLLDSTVEQACDGDGEGERWAVSPSFDRVDRLSGHTQPFGELALGQGGLGPQHTYIVSHGL